MKISAQKKPSRFPWSHWAYDPGTDKRDLRFDFLRGIAIIIMVVDHVGGESWLYTITGGNSFLVSAAEGFVFISGIVAGIVYGALARRAGLRAGLIKLIRRALTLYALTVGLTILFAESSSYFGLVWSSEVNLADFNQFAWGAVTLRQSLFLVDIPLLYTLLLLAAPIALTLLFYRRTTWLIVASVVLWSLFQIAPEQMQIPWHISNYAFNFAAWQLLFFLGMAIGFQRDVLAQKLGWIPKWLAFVLSTILLIGLVQFFDLNGGPKVFSVTAPETSLVQMMFQKNSLALGRLAACVIVFSFAFLAATLLWQPIALAFGWLFLPLGQNSLYSYTMHVVLVVLFAVVARSQPGTIFSNSVFQQLLAVFLIWGLIQLRFLFRIIPR